jgi:hypothetical protein
LSGVARTDRRFVTAALVATAAGLAVPHPAGAGSASGDGGAAAAHERSIEVRVVERDGFRWADAGIGALATVGLVLAAAGTTVALRGAPRTRNRQTRGDRA